MGNGTKDTLPKDDAVRSVAESRSEIEALHALAEHLDVLKARVPNGGQMTQRLRNWQPWIIAVLLPAFLAIAGYLLVHRDDHRDDQAFQQEVREFMAEGGRVYSSSGEPVSTDQLATTMREKWQADLGIITGAGILPVADQRVGRLEKDVSDIRTDLAQVKITVNDNRVTLSAIQLLLQER